MGRRSGDGVVVAVLLAATASVRAEENADCPTRLAARALEAEKLKDEFVDRVYPRTVFAKTKPNPTAQKVLEPLIEAAMQKLAPQPATVVECHTWACRIRVLHGAQVDPARW